MGAVFSLDLLRSTPHASRVLVMKGSLLFARLSDVLRAGSDLLLPRVSTRCRSLPRSPSADSSTTLVGGVGVAVVAEGQGEFGGGKLSADKEEEDRTGDAGRRAEAKECVSENDERNGDVQPDDYDLSAARAVVLDGLLRALLNTHPSPSQLVLFALGPNSALFECHDFPTPLSVFVLNDVSVSAECAREAARVRAKLPEGIDYAHVEAVLDGRVWDSGLVLQGYNWKKKSVWLVQMMHGLSEAWERHLRMIGTLAVPGSVVLVAYVTETYVESIGRGGEGAPHFSCDDVGAVAKRCGFEVQSVEMLREGVQKFERAEEWRGAVERSKLADEVRFALLSHSPKSSPLRPHESDVVSDASANGTKAPDAQVDGSPSAVSVAAPTVVGSLGRFSYENFEEYARSDRRPVRFELQLASLPMDLAQSQHSVVLIGSESSLGCWDPKRVRSMHGDITNRDAVLTIEVGLSVEACDIEYKYAVTNEREEIVSWEAGSNRTITLLLDEGLSRVQQISDEWRCW